VSYDDWKSTDDGDSLADWVADAHEAELCPVCHEPHGEIGSDHVACSEECGNVMVCVGLRDQIAEHYDTARATIRAIRTGVAPAEIALKLIGRLREKIENARIEIETLENRS